MFKRTKKFLLLSLACMIILCSAVFFWVAESMTGKSQEAISEIGMIYMSEMSMQLQQKFDAITTSWISQVEGIIRRTPPEENQYGQNDVYIGVPAIINHNGVRELIELDLKEEEQQKLKDSCRLMKEMRQQAIHHIWEE